MKEGSWGVYDKDERFQVRICVGCVGVGGVSRCQVIPSPSAVGDSLNLQAFNFVMA